MASELIYSFGHFRLLPERRALFAADRAVKLGGRAFDLLTALVERRDRVLSKDELMALAWPRLVVEDNNLSVQIVMLRKLLGHPAIATVPGRGYRFALPVQMAGEAPVDADLARARPTPTTAPPDSDAEQRTNLPARILPLYGREQDLAAVAALLAQHVVVTVSGAGGIGKTRLCQAAAVQALPDYPDGVWWIELAPLSRAALVASAIAETLGLDLSNGRDPTQAVLLHLRSRRVLLVLDNCEHLLPAVAAFAAAASATEAQLRLLVTSQEVLKIPAEQVYRLATLSMPEAGAALTAASVAKSGAGALFLARARGVDARFEINAKNVDAVAEICSRLDGIPLAIELAAARLPLLGIDGLRSRLNQRFNVLTGGSRAVLRRHQTLRAALDWSHGLLSADEQAVFRRLGVFAGGFTLESAQRVASDEQIDEWDVLEHLGALVDKSLVLAEGEPLPRYRFLETTRLFALEQLAAAQETAVTLRGHAQAMVALIEDFERLRQRRYSTPAELAQLALEADNVRAALDWLQQADERASDFDDLAVELGGLAGHVLESSSGALEAFERTLALRTRLSAATPPASAARYWSMLADLGVITGREESLDAARRGEALYARLLDDEGRFRCLVALIAIGARRGAAASLERDVAEAGRIEPARPEARIYFRWARYRWLMALGRPEEALTCILERAAIAREAGMLAQEQFILGDTAADCELALGRIDAAEAYSRDALQVLERESGTRRLTAHVLDTLARALVAKGCHDAAIDTARRALQLTRNEGYHFRLLEPLALNAARHGRPKDAAWITGHVDAIYAERGEVRWPDAAARRTALDAVVCAALTRQEIDGLRAAGAVAAIDAAFERALGAPLK